MALGKKVSPAKFIGTLAAGLGVAQGVTSIIGGVQDRKRLKREMGRTKKEFRRNRDTLRSMRFENPYADLQTNFENPYEDLTVNQQQAQFQADQAAQSRANILSNLQGAAGPSGIAGLAQTLANQATAQGAAASADIGRQEAANQALAAQGAVQVQAREQAAQQTVMAGEAQRQAQERQRTMNIMELRAGRNDALANLRQQRAEATQNIVGGIAGTAVSGLSLANQLGSFNKPTTDTTNNTTTNTTNNATTTTTPTNNFNLDNYSMDFVDVPEEDDPDPVDTAAVVRQLNSKTARDNYFANYQKLVDFKVLPGFKSPFPKKR